MATQSCKRSDRAIIPAVSDFTSEIEQRDFLEVHMAALSPEISAAVTAWSQGKSTRDIALAAGVSERAARKWIQTGIRQIKSSATRK